MKYVMIEYQIGEKNENIKATLIIRDGSTDFIWISSVFKICPFFHSGSNAETQVTFTHRISLVLFDLSRVLGLSSSFMDSILWYRVGLLHF